MSLSICIITLDYPEKDRPVFTFVKNIVDALADQGHHCTVIAPYSITRNRKGHVFHESYLTENNHTIDVYRPNYISFSNIKLLGFNISNLLYQNAVYKTLKKIKIKPDVIYGHFWKCGYAGYKYAEEKGIPLVVASGESEIPKDIINSKFEDFYNYTSGVICVSTKNKNESIEKGLTIEDKCIIIPNAINKKIFRKIDKKKCRNKLGIKDEAFVIISTGAFSERKGTLRISSAIEQMSDEVFSIFIGKGKEEPNCRNILFKGKVNNEDLPLYLNAADVFILPTLKEGCCNAIIEAMACGLPVISSNLPFNHDILNNTNSILINPLDINQIRNSIIILKEDITLRQHLSEGALDRAKNLTIDKRAEAISSFLELVKSRYTRNVKF